MTNPLPYQPSNSARYYRPPRRFHPVGMAGGFLAALVLGAFGSFLYVLILPNLSSLLLRCGAVVCAALAVGGLATLPIRYGKVRIPAMAATLGALLALFCLGVMWIAWLVNLLERAHTRVSYWTLIQHPAVVMRLITAAYTHGTWSYKGDIIRGPMLLVLWLIEAGAVLAAGVMIPMKNLVSGDAVCLECGSQCTPTSRLPRFATDFEGDVIAAIENRDLAALAAHPAPRHEDDPELVLRLLRCRKCHQTNVLTLNRVAWVRVGNQPKVKTTPLVDQLIVTADEADELVKVGEAIREQRASGNSSAAPTTEA